LRFSTPLEDLHISKEQQMLCTIVCQFAVLRAHLDSLAFHEMLTTVELTNANHLWLGSCVPDKQEILKTTDKQIATILANVNAGCFYSLIA